MQNDSKFPSKQNYLSIMLSAFQKFQYTRSPEVLRSYMKKNRQLLTTQIDELAKYQQPQQDRVSQLASNSQSSAYMRERELNDRLQKQYADEQEISKGNNIRQSQIRFNDKCQQMDASLFSLNKQLDKLTEQNKVLSAKLQKQRFYRQWQVMYKQYQGAHSLNLRLKQQLQKKKAQIASITKK